MYLTSKEPNVLFQTSNGNNANGERLPPTRALSNTPTKRSVGCGGQKA